MAPTDQVVAQHRCSQCTRLLDDIAVSVTAGPRETKMYCEDCFNQRHATGNTELDARLIKIKQELEGLQAIYCGGLNLDDAYWLVGQVESLARRNATLLDTALHLVESTEDWSDELDAAEEQTGLTERGQRPG